jgi:hypothetical protein
MGPWVMINAGGYEWVHNYSQPLPELLTWSSNGLLLTESTALWRVAQRLS